MSPLCTPLGNLDNKWDVQASKFVETKLFIIINTSNIAALCRKINSQIKNIDTSNIWPLQQEPPAKRATH